MSDQLFPTGDPAPGGHTSVPRAEGPLPARLRPVTLDEVVGQEHLLGTAEEPTALRRAIAEGRPHSMILYGPPGSGKTTLARVAAATASAAFEELSAVEAGREVLCFRDPRTREAHEAVNPNLSDDAIAAVQEEVFKVLGWE